MKKLVFILALLLVSCGSRKVAINNTEVKKDSMAVTEIKTVKESEIIKENINNVFVFESSEEIEICPIDTSKTILVDGKVYKNVIIRAKKNKASSLHTNIKKESETKRTDSISKSLVIKKEQTNIKTKNVDKKESIITNIWLWLLLLFIIIIIIITIRKLMKRYFI